MNQRRKSRDLCPKTYGTKSSLCVHMKKIHFSKPFECSKKFYMKAVLRNHSKMHNDKEKG